MGLAENLKTVQDNRGNVAPPPVVASAPAEVPTEVPLSVEQVFNAGNPGHETKQEPAVAEVVPGTEKPEEQVFKIGNESFTSIEDAMNHAQSLEREKLERDAYELGKQDAVPKSETPKEDLNAKFYKEMSDLMFENPAEAIKQIEQRAVDRATSTITQQSQEQTAKDQAWDKFYVDNKDLVAHKKYVNFFLNEHWNTLGPMQPEKALQKLADITREGLNEVVKSMRPEEVVPSGSAQVTGVSGDPVIQVEQPKQKLDFVQQIRKLSKRELKDLL